VRKASSAYQSGWRGVSSPWVFSGSPVAIGQAGTTVTLLEGSTFCISDRAGDVGFGKADGLFFRDLRVVSKLVVLLNGQRLEPLGFDQAEPFAGRFVARAAPAPGKADSTLLVFRNRYVGDGLRDDLLIRNYGLEAAYCRIEIEVGADFANLFAVKEGRVREDPGATVEQKVEGSSITVSYRRGATRRGIRFDLSGPGSEGMVGKAEAYQDMFVRELVIAPRGEASLCLQATPILESGEVRPRYLCGEPVVKAAPTQRMATWRRSVPLVSSDHESLSQVVERSLEDLGALRIFDPEDPERIVVAAGAPWFMTVFGRDSIITSYMALLADPGLALGTLQVLARFQGKKVDPVTEEQPGRILHEMRFGEAQNLSLGGGSVYYGTVDATPLFVVLLGELRRWGLAAELVDQLLPAADAAMAWIEDYGDLDGDGYVEYLRTSDRGLVNQGWKDSFDAIRYSNGAIASPPIALAEVQGYVYSAYLARAHFAEELGDEAGRRKYIEKAKELRRRFNEDFWLEDRGYYALGLDAKKRPIDSLASNMGQCLWTGIVDEERARAVAEALLSDRMFTGWGIRTLSADNPAYNPVSYHCGSVWPHDNALIAAGLARYGLFDHAMRVVDGMLQAAVAQGGRLPELFSGLARKDFPVVVSYPTSCSPQAWAAASPLLLVRTILQLNPWVPHNKVWINPRLPEGVRYLQVDRVPLAGSRVTIHVDDKGVEVEGLPPSIELIKAPREPATGLF
jgi:glycogen debranching enzyme